MDDFLTRRPRGVELGSFSQEVLETLSTFTAFPWPLLKTQAERAGYDPATLEASTLAPIVESLARGVARFNTPEAGEMVKAALMELVE